MIAYSTDLTTINKSNEFKKNFTIKDCIFLIAKAWETVSQETLISG